MNQTLKIHTMEQIVILLTKLKKLAMKSWMEKMRKWTTKTWMSKMKRRKMKKTKTKTKT